MLVDFENGSLIVAPVAVVRSTENGCNLIIVLKLVAFGHELMCPGDHLEVVGVIELFGDVLNVKDGLLLRR